MKRLISQTLFCLTLAVVAGTAHAGEAIAYRLANWNQMHFDDPGTAAQHLAAVQKLGCEARQENHGGHTDVVYRSAKWQALEVASDDLAHQWEAWLKGAGFETLHGHSADHSGNNHAGHDHAGHSHVGHDHGPDETEEVAYRLPDWKTTHLENVTQAAEYAALMKGLGCEVRFDEHDGQSDVSVRCVQWNHVDFPSHEVASAWEVWLKNSGFEAQHRH